MLIKGFVFEPARHAWKMITNPRYRTLAILESRYRNKRRYTSQVVQFDGWNIEIVDAPSFLSSYREIFVDKVYEFSIENKAPKVLDLGANIGLSILYFKSKFPDAKVVAFEADPKIFSVLKRNIEENGLDNVVLHQAAIWRENAELLFSSEGADGGGLSSHGESLIKVPCLDIKDILRNEQFDFIKMDIEGAENDIYQELMGLVDKTPYIFIEYHSKCSENQKLADILKMLSDEGYRVDIYSMTPCQHPFVSVKDNEQNFDLQLNIFAKK